MVDWVFAVTVGEVGQLQARLSETITKDTKSTKRRPEACLVGETDGESEGDPRYLKTSWLARCTPIANRATVPTHVKMNSSETTSTRKAKPINMPISRAIRPKSFQSSGA